MLARRRNHYSMFELPTEMVEPATMTQSVARDVCLELRDHSPRIELEGTNGWIVKVWVPHLEEVYALRDPKDVPFFLAEAGVRAAA